MNNIANKEQTFLSKGKGTEVDVYALLNILLDYKWLMLIVMSCTLVLGMFVASRQISNYKSELQLLVDAKPNSIGNSSILIESGSHNTTTTQSILVQSRYVLEPVIKRLGLDIAVASKGYSIWSRLFTAQHDSAQIKYFEVPIELINTPLDLVFDKKGHFSLYDSHALLLQGPIGALLNDKTKNIQLQVDSIVAPIGTHFVLTKRSIGLVVAGLNSRLSVREAASQTGVLNLSLVGSNVALLMKTLNAIASTMQEKDAIKKTKEAEQSLQFLYKQLPLTKNLLESAETALNHYRSKSGKVDIKLQTQFLVQQLMNFDKRINELRVKKVDQLQKYTNIHPLIQAIDIKLKTLENSRSELERKVKALPDADQVAVDLQREVGVRKTLYIVLLNKIQELEVMKAGTVSGIQILTPATPPDAPLPTHRLFIYLLCLSLGFGITVMFILGRRLFSPRVDDPYWTEHKYNLANLAIIPYCKEQATLSSVLLAQRKGEGQGLLAHTHPTNLSVEALRSLRTSLQVMLATASNNIVTILGVSPGAGKSFISSNLAYLLAAAGEKVLVIDGDLRRGVLHKYFGYSPAPGMADVLNGTLSLENVFRETMHPNLTFLPRGKYPSDPSELLTSSKFKELIATLSSQFDIVVIDSAPVLLVTDAVVLGALSGTNFLVLSAGVHQPTEVEIVLKRLTSSNITVNGTIYNYNRPATLTRSYGGYYKYGKYYNYYDDKSTQYTPRY